MMLKRGQFPREQFYGQFRQYFRIVRKYRRKFGNIGGAGNETFKTGIISRAVNMCKCACIIQEVLRDRKKWVAEERERLVRGHFRQG